MKDQQMKRFADWIISYRFPLLAGIVLLTVFWGYQLTKLQIDSDILNYLPQDDPAVVQFREIGEKFGGNSLAIIALENEDVFNPHTLARIDTITSRFQALPEVSQVLSVTDILDIKKIPDGIEVGKLIKKKRIPQDPQQLHELREYTLSKDMYRGNLVSADGKTTLIVTRIREEASKTDVAEKMKAIVKSTEGNETVYYAGIPFQMIFLTDIITGDLARLVPIVALLVVLVLYLSFGSLRGVLLPLGTVLISTIWTLGFMSWMRFDLTIASAAIPVLLIAIGSAYGIHLISRYRENCELQITNRDCVTLSTATIALPIIMAGMTTLAGFLAFSFSYLTMIREFGIFASVGIFVAMVLSLILIPIVLSFLPMRKPRSSAKKEEKTTWLSRVMDWMADQILARKKLILSGGVLLLIAAIIAIPRLHREVNMVEYFKHDSEIRQAEDMMESRFGGSIPVQILVNGDIKDPLVLKQMYALEKYLRTLPHVNNPQSVADLIAELNEQMNGRHTIPDSREKVANLWVFIDGNKVMDQLIADNDTCALIQANIGTVNTQRLIATVDSINQYLASDFPDQLLRLKVDTLDDSLWDEVQEYRLTQVAGLIIFDAKYYGIERMDSNQVTSLLRNIESPRVQHLTPKQANAINQAIAAYFHSDAADLVIDSDSVIREVLAGLEPLYLNSMPDEAGVASVLLRYVPQSIYSDDPEAIEYAAPALTSLIIEQRQQAIVEYMTDRILELTTDIPLTSLASFRRDIQGDIWMLVQDYVGLPLVSVTSALPVADCVTLTSSHTGMPIIFKNLDANIIKSQVFSLTAAFVLLFLFLSFRFRSLTGGLISLAPITFTLLCNFILMVAMNVPLDAVTVLIGSVALGIGVDYTIHFLTRFQIEFKSGKSIHDALHTTLQTAGRAILINATSVMMGFLVLVLGNIVPMQRFGYLTAVTMVTSALGAITLLPALILLTKARFIGDFDRVAERINRRFNGLKTIRGRRVSR
jgi:predicted RND superfamily exporter protein